MHFYRHLTTEDLNEIHPSVAQTSMSKEKGFWRTTEHLYLLVKQAVLHLREEYCSYPAMIQDNGVELSIKFTVSLSNIITRKPGKEGPLGGKMLAFDPSGPKAGVNDKKKKDKH